MEFNLKEECKDTKISELNNGGTHLEFYLKEGSKLSEFLKEKCKDTESISLDTMNKLKGIWIGNIITLHT